jgi:hypothetical protein
VASRSAACAGSFYLRWPGDIREQVGNDQLDLIGMLKERGRQRIPTPNRLMLRQPRCHGRHVRLEQRGHLRVARFGRRFDAVREQPDGPVDRLVTSEELVDGLHVGAAVMLHV